MVEKQLSHVYVVNISVKRVEVEAVWKTVFTSITSFVTTVSCSFVISIVVVNVVVDSNTSSTSTITTSAS